MDELMATIKLFAGNFAPQGYLPCDGRLLPISQYSALYSLLGNVYGGDGRQSFALPNLNGRVPVGIGQSSTGKTVQLGEAAGKPQITLSTSNLPSFTSPIKVANSNGNTATPSASTSIAIPIVPNGRESVTASGFSNANPDTLINGQSVSFQGQNAPIDSMPPYLGLYYIICVQGIFPSRP